MTNVASEMADAIPSSFDVSPTISANGTLRADSWAFENMVDAFKTALGDMKIELDDEVAGRFVDRTIARAIYG